MTRDLAAPFLILALGAFLLAGTMLHHDVSWYLISTGWWLNGVPIYVDIFELNPPLAFYLTAPPVWVSQLLDVSAIAAYKAYVFALIMISLIMTRAIFRSSRTVADVQCRVFLAVAALGLVLFPLGDFGQRDHLFAIFFLPYLAMNLVPEPQSRKTRAAIATWATLGVALKHYFLLLPLLILIYRFVSERSLRPILRIEFLLPAVLLIAYVGAAFLLHPAYFDSIIPRTLQVYGIYEAKLSVVIYRSVPLILITSLALGLMAMSRERNQASTISLVVAAGAIGVYLIQSKGWSYHRVPADLYVALALIWAAAELSRVRRHNWPYIPAAIAIAMLVVPALKNGPYSNEFYKKAEAHFTCPAGQRSFQIFSAKVSRGFPLANYAQAEPANRAPALWLFPGAAYRLSQTDNPEEKAKYLAILSDARAMVLNDFFRVRPQVMFVDAGEYKAYFKDAKFDYLEYFQEDAAFANTWPEYSLAGKVDNFDVYTRPGCDM